MGNVPQTCADVLPVDLVSKRDPSWPRLSGKQLSPRHNTKQTLDARKKFIGLFRVTPYGSMYPTTHVSLDP